MCGLGLLSWGRERGKLLLCFVLTMCNDMGQVFVSFDKGDVFSISFFYGSSLQSRWRVRTTDFTKKLVEVI